MTRQQGAPGGGTVQNRTVFVATAGIDIGTAIAAGLVAAGARVAWITDGEEPRQSSGLSVVRIGTNFDSRAALEGAFAQATERIGPPTQIVHSALPEIAVASAEIAALSAAHWSASCRAALSATLYCLQAAFMQLNGRGGSIVLIGPSLSLAGAAGLVPLSTAVEGQRGLAKSSARQWGRAGITVNWIAAAPTALSPLFAKTALPTKPDPIPVAFGRPLDLQAEIVPMIDFLGRSAGRALTGATLVLDGGEWMVP
ncbi:MAG TPA: SDR family oxidoreductase [Burkholderiaceae bacterium]|nr:SDR family oxidoreductase [Burkholderiaceae bacterium]